jgi:FRG domain
MPTLTIININGFQEFLDSVDGDQKSDETSLWFRGVGNATYKLKPTIHRHPKIINEATLLGYEDKLITRFKERSVPYLKNRIDDIWEILFLMQHFGMPTRLLDWTENPLLALFFALSSAPQNSTGGYDDDAAVWVLWPAKWNQDIFKHNTYKGNALSPTDQLVKSYQPGTEPRYINENPVAILGIHNSPRIVAQRGSFCLFGKSLIPMEDIYTNGTFEQDTLKKIIIPKLMINDLLNKLLWMGITDAVIYPDLEGLARETKRQFGFKV